MLFGFQLPASLLVLMAIAAAEAHLTFASMRNLTSVTQECRDRILGLGLAPKLEVRGRVHMALLWDEKREVEDKVFASLKMLTTSLLTELESPRLIPSLKAEGLFPSPEECIVVKDEYHSFLEATVLYVHEVQERQMRWRWEKESEVSNEVEKLQGLWASRSSNSQGWSFIEQQMNLYGETSCFKKSHEVLRRGVEVVEYLNDLIDEFP